jgi:polyketide biosynthesis 3-hydroxy-3-methylglutaryl-CoA synthase-like enzyme PksG
VGANGYYGYEVMDTCRPMPDSEAGDADLSLLSYLDCCEHSYREYQKRIADVDYAGTFGYLAFHTPFGGMIHGAHRSMMRKFTQIKEADAIQADFDRRVQPGLSYCQRVGNVMGATTALSLLSTIVHGHFDTPQRIGIFSYGSGCCSEFYSGVATAQGQQRLNSMNLDAQLNRRYSLSLDDYDALLTGSHAVKFGVRNVTLDWDFLPQARQPGFLYLQAIREFHREYEWA